MALRLEAIIGLNSHAFTHGMERVKESVAESVKGFVIGAAGVYGLEEAFSKTIEKGDELTNTARRLNIPIEKLQVLRQAAKNAGADVEGIANALEKVNQARAMAMGFGLTATGMTKDEYKGQFAQLGISQKQLETMSAGDLLLGPIAEKLKQVNPETIIQPLRTILGRAGGAMIPALQNNLDELEEEMKKSGALMSAQTAAELSAINDKIHLVGEIVTTEMGPVVIKVAEVLLYLVGHIKAAADYLGGLTHGLTFKDIAKQAIPVYGFYQMYKNAKKVFSSENMNQAAAGMEDPNGLLNKFREEAKNATKKGAVVPFSMDENEDEGKAKKPKRDSKMDADSLVKVGNFLGSNRGAIQSAARMEHYASQTATNTGKMLTTLEKLAKDNGLVGDSKHGWHAPTEIPVN